MSRAATRAACLASVLLAAALAAPATADAPKRIVALTPFSANTLAALGVKPVAIGQTLGGDENFAPSLRRVRALPLAHPNGPNMEQLASLRPGLVLSSPTWARGNRTMRKLDMRVEFPEPLTVLDMYDRIEDIAAMVERERAGRRLVARIKRQISRAWGERRTSSSPTAGAATSCSSPARASWTRAPSPAAGSRASPTRRSWPRTPT